MRGAVAGAHAAIDRQRDRRGRVASIIRRSARDLRRAGRSRKAWPPKPGLTPITSTISTRSITHAIASTGVAGFSTTPGLLAQRPRSAAASGADAARPRGAPGCGRRRPRRRPRGRGRPARSSGARRRAGACACAAPRSTGGPKVMLGTKCPSMTSRCSQSAPAASTAAHFLGEPGEIGGEQAGGDADRARRRRWHRAGSSEAARRGTSDQVFVEAGDEESVHAAALGPQRRGGAHAARRRSAPAARPGTSSGRTGAACRRQPGERRGDRVGALLRLQRADGIDQAPAGTQHRAGGVQQPVLLAASAGDVARALQVRHVGMAADGAGGAARRVEQHRVERRRRAPGGGVRRDDLGGKPQPGQSSRAAGRGAPGRARPR